MAYVPLGVHTEYSFLNGLCRIEALVERARTLRLESVGIADGHSAYGLVPFYVAARAAGIRPILGVRVQLQADLPDQDGGGGAPAQLVLMARDAHGYRNLLQLLTRAHLECGAEEPGVGFQDLERFAPGVVALDGGASGPIVAALKRGRTRAAERTASRLRSIFGADAFYIEVQRLGRPELARLEPQVLHLARALNVPVVATNEARFLEPADAAALDLLRHIAGDADAERRSAAHVLHGEHDMQALYRDLPEALANTCLVAEQCDVELDLGAGLDAAHRTASGQEPRAALRRACERGACARYGTPSYVELPVAVRDRIAHELAVIGERELASCFLIVQDVVRCAKEEGISVGPGRGAAAGSLVCFALGITGVDPLEHELVFERFLARGAGALPAFAIDIEHRRRDELLQLARRRLGEDRAVREATLQTFSAPALLGAAEAWRADGSASEGGLPTRHGGTAARPAEAEPARRQAVLDVVRRLEGLPRIPALHAGGLLVRTGPLHEVVALQRTPSGEVVAQVLPQAASAHGLVRIELVACRTPGLIRTVSASTSVDVEPLTLDDAATLHAIARGDVTGVPELESGSMRRVLREVRPARFADIAAAAALHRGPSEDLLRRYAARREGFETAPAEPPEIEAVLAETHGLMLFPEQLMRVAARMAGYGLEQAEALRSALQRRDVGALARERARFLRGAVENGMTLDASERVFESMMRFTGFALDKASVVGACVSAYRAAYLRAHHPAAFAVAQLRAEAGRERRRRRLLADAVAHGVSILGVDVNLSDVDFTLEAGNVRAGLGNLRRLGPDAGRIVAERRQRGAYRSLGDFWQRVGARLGSACLDLAVAGGFASLGMTRTEAVRGVRTLRARSPHAARDDGQLQLAFVGAAAERAHGVAPAQEAGEAAPGHVAVLDLEGDPLLRMGHLWSAGHAVPSCVLASEPARARVRAAGVVVSLGPKSDIASSVDMEDLWGRIPVFVPREALARSAVKLANVGEAIFVEGRIDRRDAALRLVAERLRDARALGSPQLDLFAVGDERGRGERRLGQGRGGSRRRTAGDGAVHGPRKGPGRAPGARRGAAEQASG